MKIRRGRKLSNRKCEPKLGEVNGNSLTGSSWPCGGLLRRGTERKALVLKQKGC